LEVTVVTFFGIWWLIVIQSSLSLILKTTVAFKDNCCHAIDVNVIKNKKEKCICASAFVLIRSNHVLIFLIQGSMLLCTILIQSLV